jgi:CDP-glucose 4,6-dehydratase
MVQLKGLRKMFELLSFFKGRRIMITGHTGFKGSWLAELLTSNGANVLGYALPPEQSDSHFSQLMLKDKMEHVEADIRDFSTLKNTFHSFKPEIIIHLAAQSLVRRSYENPKTTFDTNVGGTVNVLECIRESTHIRSAVLITSDKCYLNKEWVWGYRENDELGGHDPYSASKSSAENVISAYYHSYFSQNNNIGVASTRAGNVIGGGDWANDRIIPDCIRSLIADKPIELRNPNATRPWQHVLEPLRGYLTLAKSICENPGSLFSSAWNFGPETTMVRTVGELAKKVIQVWGTGQLVSGDFQGPYEATLLQLNCDKAKQHLGWKPCLDFNSTVDMTASWYRRVADGENPNLVTQSQIKEYSKHVGSCK